MPPASRPKKTEGAGEGNQGEQGAERRREGHEAEDDRRGERDEEGGGEENVGG